MMGNKNYIKGRRKEYQICNKLREEGFDVVQRSAGSHSPVDIIAIRKADKKIKLVQSKPNTMLDNAIKKILEDNDWMNGKFNVEFIVK